MQRRYLLQFEATEIQLIVVGSASAVVPGYGRLMVLHFDLAVLVVKGVAWSVILWEERKKEKRRVYGHGLQLILLSKPRMLLESLKG